MTRSVSPITDAQFDSEVLGSDEPVVVYFWAPWCGPCRLMSPIMDWVAETYPHVKVVKMEVDPNPDAVSKCNIQGVPALAMFRDGQSVQSVEGAVSKSKMTSLLDMHLSPAT